MTKLAQVMDRFGLTVADVAKITGHSQPTISQLKAGNYNGKNGKEQEVLNILAESGYMLEPKKIVVRSDVFITTKNVKRFNELCDEMFSEEADLTSSIGVVIGRAGRGKTKAARHYCINKPEAVYVQFLDGFSLVDVAREIAYELGGVRPRGFRACLDVIEESTIAYRKIAIIDEADKMPKKYFEMIRGLNERCNMPIVLVGEESLKRILDSERRLKSRTRRVVAFEPISVEDVFVYYEKALGLSLDVSIVKKLHKKASGDFRFVVRDAINIARIININGLTEVDEKVLRALNG
ncbi:ATP-binding protein [Deferribacter autotrophicus]|uniref:ATP-binding protein n=1 Tax=Deferribacter autotrophicus TaxID=500465 RepID=A0A5A8EZT0_9BACT|nr:AAA family ATPase [Deferribacter autotrophicus]KAA0257190.1 ATP-binding protein [Deferribacter autotrophicus]